MHMADSKCDDTSMDQVQSPGLLDSSSRLRCNHQEGQNEAESNNSTHGQPQKSPVQFLDLVLDIQLDIMALLPLESLLCFRQTCRRVHANSLDPSLWHVLRAPSTVDNVTGVSANIGGGGEHVNGGVSASGSGWNNNSVSSSILSSSTSVLQRSARRQRRTSMSMASRSMLGMGSSGASNNSDSIRPVGDINNRDGNSSQSGQGSSASQAANHLLPTTNNSNYLEAIEGSGEGSSGTGTTGAINPGPGGGNGLHVFSDSELFSDSFAAILAANRQMRQQQLECQLLRQQQQQQQQRVQQTFTASLTSLDPRQEYAAKVLGLHPSAYSLLQPDSLSPKLREHTFASMLMTPSTGLILQQQRKQSLQRQQQADQSNCSITTTPSLTDGGEGNQMSTSSKEQQRRQQLLELEGWGNNMVSPLLSRPAEYDSWNLRSQSFLEFLAMLTFKYVAPEEEDGVHQEPKNVNIHIATPTLTKTVSVKTEAKVKSTSDFSIYHHRPPLSHAIRQVNLDNEKDLTQNAHFKLMQQFINLTSLSMVSGQLVGHGGIVPSRTNVGMNDVESYCWMHLTKLDLSKNLQLSDLAGILSNSPQLQMLSLDGCSAIRSFEPLYRSKCRGNLIKLNLSRTKVRDSDIVQIMGYTTPPPRSGVSTSTTITTTHSSTTLPSSFFSTSEQESSVTTLTGSAPPKLLTNNNKLQELRLDQCYELSRRALVAIGNQGHHLTLLALNNCCDLQDDAIRELAVGCHRLQLVMIRGIRLVNEDTLDWLRENQVPLRKALGPLGGWRHWTESV